MAERIARRVGAASGPVESSNTDISSELSAIRVSLNDLHNRLIQIESRVTAPTIHSPWLAGVNASHPSQERFGVEEATVSELVDFFQNEKTCTVEPGGKPCDHCAMCSTRGF